MKSLWSINGAQSSATSDSTVVSLFENTPNEPDAEPPPLPISPESHAAAVEDSRQRLIAEEIAAMPEGHCNGKGWMPMKTGEGYLPVREGHSCPACIIAPQIPMTASVNPADGPVPDAVKAATPLAPEAIAAIGHSGIRATAEAHAAESARRSAAEAAAAPVPRSGGRCSGGGQYLVMTDREKLSRRKKCPVCGKDMKIKDEHISQDCTQFIVPKHNLPKVAASAAPAVPPLPVVATTSPPPPPLPVEPFAPPLPASSSTATDKSSALEEIAFKLFSELRRHPQYRPGEVRDLSISLSSVYVTQLGAVLGFGVAP